MCDPVQPTLQAIVRYPIKSLPGEALEMAQLKQDRGIEGDRAYAFALKHQPIAANGAWTPCSSFERLTIRPKMAAWTLERDGQKRIFNGQDGSSILLPNSDRKTSMAAIVRGEPFGGADLVRAKLSYWDHEDGTLSIINLSTLEAIGQITGHVLDPARFRANLYVRAEPWSEFGWLGRTLRLGDASLKVIRPIDRCKATSVDPETAKADVNVPALLMRYFGHLFCGVYACVDQSGPIAAGDPIVIADDELDVSGIGAAAAQPTAPPMADWPRCAEVSEVIEETCQVRSLWLSDPLAQAGSLTRYHAGQHLRLHNLTGDETWRAYTVSGVDHQRGRLRISVKRDSGLGSQAVHRLETGARVMISGPVGELRVPMAEGPIWLLTAGIGITPAIAALHRRAEEIAARAVRFIHTVPTMAETALWHEAVALLDQTVDEAILHLTTSVELQDFNRVEQGRPDLNAIAAQIAGEGGSVLICGPSAFTQDALAAFETAGVPPEHIATETFVSPSAVPALSRPPESGPFVVRFARSDIEATWTERKGPLLDFAEALGLNPPSHCRAGVCRKCSARVISGEGIELVSSHASSRGRLLLCCAVPTSDLEVDA